MYLHEKGEQEYEVNSIRALVYKTETIYSIANAYIYLYMINRYSLLVCDTTQSGISAPMFQRNLLAPLYYQSALIYFKEKAGGSSATSVHFYQNIRHHIPKHSNLQLLL